MKKIKEITEKASKLKKEETPVIPIVKGFKAFNKGLKCRDFQYQENSIFETHENIKPCEKGFHFCKLPLDVLNYYSPWDEFAEVEALGKIIDHEDKTVTSKIKILSKISLSKLFKWHFDLVFEKVKIEKQTTNTAGNYAHANTAGNYAHANTAGYKAHANTAGYKAHANTAGNYAHANTAGENAHANTAGENAIANTAGENAIANTAGNYAHANTAGYKAHANTAGENAIACALGYQSRAKAVKGWIVIVDWQNGDIKGIHSSKVGGKINKIKIEADRWYWFENGILKSE